MSSDRNKPPSPPDTSRDTSSDTDDDDSFLMEAAALSEPVLPGTLPVTPLEVGELVGGRFRIGRFAGSGGMGAVYRATDLSTGRDAAIKVMEKQSGSARERFTREAAVLAELTHPCIVQYVTHGTTPHGLPFLAMDWLDGEDLSHRLGRAPLEVNESMALAKRASEGLAFAHAHGVVHRDIKPSNLLLVDRDPAQAKVIDFGVARVQAGGALTRRGTSLGTAGYMSPEQAREAADVDARADVYALGCVLFECLTGRPPFVGRPATLLVKVLRETPPRPSSLRADLGDEIDALVGRLLAKDREQRPKDAAEVLAALDAIKRVLR